MAVSWSSTDGHMRVGIDVSFSTVTSSDTTVDVTIDYWTENTYTFSDNQTLNYNDETTSGTTAYNYTNSQGAVQTKRKTTTKTLAISYSGGPTYTATAEVTGAFDGSNPSKSRSYTLPARPAAIPSGGSIAVSSVGSSTATATLSGFASNGDTIDSYEIQIATNSGFTTGLATYSGSSKAFTGLAAATTYWVRGRAHNGVGYSAYTASKSFTTGATVPGAPTGVGNNTVTQNSANITWTAPASNGGSAITGYEIQIATDSGFTLNVQTFTDPDDVSPYALTGINPATTYYARVRALNGVGASPWSAATNFTTLTGTPSIITPAASEASSRGWPYAVVSATGIQASSTITLEVGKDSSFTPVAMTTFASTDVIQRTDAGAHGLVEGDVIYFTAASSAPLATATPYYVIASGLTSTSFKVSTTPGGTAVDITASGTATMVRWATVTLTPGSASANNQYTLEDQNIRLNNGTYYARARVTTTSISYTTPNSATTTYTISHTPAALASSPAAGTTAKYTASTNFTFQFSDPSTVDRMSAYQLVIELNADGSSVYDSGKTVLASTANPQSITRAVALAATVKGQVLRWKVRVWDRNDQVSTYSSYNTLTLVDAPLVTITSPTNGSTVTTGTPTFTWTFSAPSGGTQATAVVEVRDSATNVVIWSKTITGTAVSTTPSTIILTNGGSYTVTVTATDTYGLSTTVSNAFTAAYSAPSSIAYTFDADDADTYGYIDVDWTAATADSLFISWKVYRKALSDTSDDWGLPVYRTTDQNVRHYLDYLITPGETYSYSVTQEAYRSGSVLESPVGYYYDSLNNLTLETRYDTPDIEHYWIIDPVNNQNSVMLENVTADDNTLEFESETYNIIGRGRHRDYGDELGYTGSLTCQVRGLEQSSAFRKKIEKLRRAQQTYYLRTPFGRLFEVALGDLGWSPMAGTGLSEMGTMTIPYEEVSD